MSNFTDAEFVFFFKGLCSAFPQTYGMASDPTVVKVWQTTLADFTMTELMEVLRRLVVECDKMPSLKKIIETGQIVRGGVCEASEAKSLRLAQNTIRAVARFGSINSDRACQHLGPLAWAGVCRFPGGWEGLCDKLTNSNEPFIQKEIHQSILDIIDSGQETMFEDHYNQNMKLLSGSVQEALQIASGGVHSVAERKPFVKGSMLNELKDVFRGRNTNAKPSEAVPTERLEPKPVASTEQPMGGEEPPPF